MRPSPEPTGSGFPSLSNSAHTRTLDGPSGTSGVNRSTVTVWRGGELVEVRACPAGESGQPAQGGGKRGLVSTIQSFASRRRMGQFLGTLQSESIPAFITLTIPSWACPTPDALRAAMAALRHRFERAFPDGAAVWKREHHRSGVPHFHLLVWLNTGRPLSWEVLQLRRWLPSAWSEVLTIKARVNVQAARDAKAVKQYASGYLWRGKGYQLDAQGTHWGKWWGKWNVDRLPFAEPVVVQGPASMFHATVRAAGRAGYRGKRRRNGQPTARFLVKHNVDAWAILAERSGGTVQGSNTDANDLEDLPESDPVGEAGGSA